MGGYRAKELLAPASLETVHRKTMGAVHSVEKDIAHFQTRQLTTNTSPNPNWTKYVRELCERHDKDIAQVEDINDVKLMLEREETDPPLKKEVKEDPRKGKRKTTAKPGTASTVPGESEVPAEVKLFETAKPTEFPEFAELKRLCERAKVFEYVAFSVKNQIETAYTSQLKKYCLSFEQEGKGVTLNSVREYENRIIHWSDDIQGKLDKIDSILDEHDRYKSNVNSYVSDYGQVIALMSDTCRVILQTVEPMKKWVSSDATYARRVQEEITQYNRLKMELKDKLKTIEDKREEISANTKRKAFACMQLELDLQRVRESKKTVRRRELDIGDVVVRINAELKRKKHDLEEVKSRLTTRKENSPTVFNYLSSMNEAIKEDIRILEAKTRAQNQQVMNLQREQVDLTKQTDAITRELKENQKSHDKSYRQLEKVDGELRNVRNNQQERENQIAMLKRIREIKLHTNTVKKIYHFGYQPGNMQNKDELSEAIRITAEGLGRDWVQLYQKLPFQPYRDFENRSRDIEVIDLSTRRVQSGGYRTVAYKSLEKWRRLHNTPTLHDLIKTLRKIHKKDTVNRIQKEVMLSSPVRKQRRHPNYKHFYVTA